MCTLQEGGSRFFTCWVPRPVPGATLAWYLNGQKQEINISTADTARILTLTAQHSNHQLNCSLTNLTSSETYNTSILLNVQCKVRGAGLLQNGMWGGRVGPPIQLGQDHNLHPSQPQQGSILSVLCKQGRQALVDPGETNPAPSCVAPIPPAHLTASVFYPDKLEILREGAPYQEVEGAGLLLMLFVLVQANPPASIIWVDQDGHVMANSSKFLLLGARSYSGLANHSLFIHLSCTAGNLSISGANSVGITTASLLPTGSC